MTDDNHLVMEYKISDEISDGVPEMCKGFTECKGCPLENVKGLCRRQSTPFTYGWSFTHITEGL